MRMKNFFYQELHSTYELGNVKRDTTLTNWSKKIKLRKINQNTNALLKFK